MEEESGARINIKEVDGEGSVDITGEESARNKAKQIIEAIVRLVQQVVTVMYLILTSYLGVLRSE